MMPRDSTTGDRVTYAPPSSTTSMSWARSRPSVVSAVRWRTSDGGRSGERLLHVALGDLQPLEHVVPPELELFRPRWSAKIQRRWLGRDHDIDRAGRAPCHLPGGMRHQQHRLVHVAHVPRSEHRLVALDEEDFVRGGGGPLHDRGGRRPRYVRADTDGPAGRPPRG